MSTQPSFDNGVDDIDLTAAEYVVGVLDANGNRLARERIEREPAFAAEVSRWESWFSPWLEAIEPVDAPANAWSRVRGTLWQHELPARNAAAAETTVSLWQNMGFWRGLAAGGFAVAFASVAALLLTTRQLPPASTGPTPPPLVVATRPAHGPMVVSLKQDDGSTAYVATIDAERGTVVLVPVQLGGDSSLSPELWLIPAGDRPHSLGMIERGKAMVVNIPMALRGAAIDGLFAISLEPAGSQQHEAPTGPVVAKGSVTRLQVET